MTLLSKLANLQKAGKPVVLCVVVRATGSTPRHVGSKMLVHPDGSIDGTIGGGEMESRVIQEALAALADEQCRTLEYSMTKPDRGDPGVCGGTMEIFVEPILPEPTVVVVGAGHVGQAVVRLAHWMEYRVVVSDDRAEFANEAVVPCADQYHVGPASALSEDIAIDAQTFILLTTRNIGVDIESLPALLDTPARYIGVIGSKRRWATARKKMVASGVSASVLDRVVSPIGLEINAETPEEIAVSIMAEITRCRRGGSGQAMSEDEG